ncbi:MAG TPA: methyltransferase [Bryobacteraceae bacterium]|nr:methyltransferase [Bryobacteraceae bacterium]
MLTGKWISASLSVVAELGIADLLAQGDKTALELAAATSAHASSLYRVLRALASVGVFAETEGGRFTLTPLAECLRSGVPNSMKEFARFVAMPGASRSWEQLLHCVKTGESGLRKAFGAANPFDYFKTHPEEAKIFDGAMTDNSRQSAPAVAEAYDFGAFRQIVDVAGGRGLLLATILKRFANVNGVLFDLPAVIEGAKAALASYGLDGRCQAVGGDFFQEVPSGADAYILKHIIHDWDDERAAAILRNIREAMDPSGRVLIVEVVIAPGNEPSFGKLLDLEMMVIPGGRERTGDEYRELLAAAGFRLAQIHPTYAPPSIIEGVPV